MNVLKNPCNVSLSWCYAKRQASETAFLGHTALVRLQWLLEPHTKVCLACGHLGHLLPTSVCLVQLLIVTPCWYLPWEVAPDGSCTWIPAATVGSQDWVLNSWLPPGVTATTAFGEWISGWSVCVLSHSLFIFVCFLNKMKRNKH